MNYLKTYVGRVLNSISQCANAIFVNGNPDVSISARIGQENYFHNNKLYRVFEWIVDKTFYPIDGKEHCRNAYLRDRKEDFTVGRGSKVGEILMALVVVFSCIPLAIAFWTYHLFKKIL